MDVNRRFQPPPKSLLDLPYMRGHGYRARKAVFMQLAVRCPRSNTDHADRAVHVETEVALEPLAVAKLLKAVADKEQPQILLLGKQAIDDDANQTAQMLAALMNAPQGTFAGKLEIDGVEAVVTREIDGGMETVALKLPAVISADLRLNEPRYVKLPQIMQAKKKPLEKSTPEELGVNTAPRMQAVSYAEPKARKAGEKVGSVAELVEKLKAAKVI